MQQQDQAKYLDAIPTGDEIRQEARHRPVKSVCRCRPDTENEEPGQKAFDIG